MNNTYLGLLTAAALLLGACSKKEDTAPTNTGTINLTATVNGAQQVPAPITTAATGSFMGTYDTGTKLLTYTIVYTGLTPTIAHIHSGASNATGPVQVPFNNLTSPISGSVTLTPAQAEDLLNDRMYVNIHTQANPGGEIRGNIRKQ